jgi:hypothetical protein
MEATYCYVCKQDSFICYTAGILNFMGFVIMTTITFDTLKFANTLKAAGVPPAQAEAEAAALSEVLEVNLKDLVSKEYMHHEMRDLEQRLIIKLGTLMALSIGIVAALVKLL